MDKRRYCRWLPLVTVLTFAFILVGCGSPPSNESLTNRTMTVYSSPTCSCCERYVDYLKGRGMDVKSITVPTGEISRLKMVHGVPRQVRSCHTVTIDDYFVEGHVPAEAIAKLIEEQPDLAGISIPGMKKNTPGMGPPVGKTFSVTSVDGQGQTGEFTRVKY